MPGTRYLYALGLVTRIPITAIPTAITLRVVLGMHRGFAASGLAAAAIALGTACGAPLLGRLMDRHGARTVLAITTVAQALFWLAAAVLPFELLVPAAFFGGALSLPVFSLTRLAITSMLSADDHRAGMALDSMSIEVSYCAGPALGVIAVTQLGSSVAMLAIGASLVIAGAGFILLDPPTTPVVPEQPEDVQDVEDVRMSQDLPASTVSSPALSHANWLTPRAVAALVATCGATFTLSGTDIALTSSMRAFGHIGLLGVVIIVSCMASLIGGFAYGLMSRRRDPLLLLVLLAAFTVLLALAGSWWALLVLIIPSGLFCAPLMSSTAEVMTASIAADKRGRALGFHTSALTLGNAAGAPLAGVAVDRWSPGSGFVAVGVLGTALALGALAVRSRRQPGLVQPNTA